MKSRQKTKRNKRPSRNSRSKAHTRYARNMRGGKADREQATDFIFFKPSINPKTAYTHYIVYNNIPKYLNIFDMNSYLFEEIEQELQAYSKNQFVIPAYKYRMNVATNHARTLEQQKNEKAQLEAKIEKLKNKQTELENLKK